MFLIFKRYDIFFAATMLFAAWMMYVSLTRTLPASTPVAPNTIVIDPGHGGMDGGAISPNGVEEKNLNLAVSFFLKEIAEADGMNVIMTRTEDVSLHTTESSKIRVQKRSDLEVRRKILNETGALAFISVHMNKFEQSKYRGAQVFYANNDKSKLLGNLIQQCLIEGMADGNARSAKTVPAEVYMFKGTRQTAVIVECGFLSNPEEERLLRQEEYQKRIAACIYDGLKKYLTNI